MLLSRRDIAHVAAVGLCISRQAFDARSLERELQAAIDSSQWRRFVQNRVPGDRSSPAA